MAGIKTLVLTGPFSDCVWLEDVVWREARVISRPEQSVSVHFASATTDVQI